MAKTKELYAQELIAKRDVERGEAAAVRQKVAAVQSQLKSTDVQIAEALVEVEAEQCSEH